MIPYGQNIFLRLMKLMDLVLMVSAFAVTAWIVHYNIESVPFEELVTMRMKVLNFILFMSIGWVWYWIFSSFGLYQSNRLVISKKYIFDIIKATTVGALVIFIDSFLFEIGLITLTFICIFWVLSTALTILSRIFLTNLFEHSDGSQNFNNDTGIYAKEAFVKIIEKERFRADRYNCSYSLLLFSIDRLEEHSGILNRLFEKIARRIRIIDEIGWYDKQKVGILLPYTPHKGACKLARHIHSIMEDIGYKQECEIFTYPMLSNKTERIELERELEDG